MDKIKVAVLFGGQSSEHSVSELSVTNVLSQMDTDKFEPYMVGITTEGKWYLYEGEIKDIRECGWEKSGKITPAFIAPDASLGGLVVMRKQGVEILPVDVCYPVLHGKWGEDGTVQGLCALAKLPCVGPDMLSSAICMDKTIAKIMFKHLNIPQADWVTVHKRELDFPDIRIAEIEGKLGYPVFVKPANAGSSVGIAKAKNREDLLKALEVAAQHDDKILVEEFIKGHEVESAPLGNGNRIFVPMPGEVISANEFYDFEAKYQIESTIRIPADLKPEVADRVRLYAKRIFEGIGLSGQSRIDFFVTDDDRVLINEVNTLPGFTDISMYPKMLEKGGVPQKELITSLIELAMDKFADQDTAASFAGKMAFCSITGGEKISFEVPCSYAFDGTNAVLAFSEPDTDAGKGAQNRITLQDNKLTVVRQGDSNSEVVFQLNTIGKVPYKYETPYGAMNLTAKTEIVYFDPTPYGATCKLVYDMYQDNDKLNTCEITFEVTKA